jgi:preprotein translocase subunit SecD
MEKSWYWRLVLIVGAIALAAYYVAPTMIYFLAPPETRRLKDEMAKLIPDWLPKKRMNLGIDLQGGLHLVMGVDTEKAVQDRADRAGDEIFAELKEKGKAPKSVRRTGDLPELEIILGSSADFDAFQEIAEGYGDTWEIRSNAGERVVFGMNSEYEDTLRKDAVAQAQKTLRNRIDEYGLTEPDVRTRGSNSIMIQIAGLTADQERNVKDSIIGKTAQLEFKAVDDESSYFVDLAAKGLPEGVELSAETYRGREEVLVNPRFLEAPKREMLEALVKANPPPPDRVVRYEDLKPETGTRFRTWLLDRKTPLTGDSLTNAFVAFDNDKSQYYVAMKFDQKGAVVFERLTRENTRGRMAVVLDDLVETAPVIEGPIPGGNASITMGGFKNQQEILDDAKELSVVLKAGALPAPVYPQEERTVGATLGDDAISKGKAAVFWTVMIIIVMMLVYYRGAGAIGLTALAANITMLLATLSFFNATLTLPGIAGLALTIGMALDANIIQFERIRDELRAGKTARAAVDAGFDKAFSAIFDSNMTTALAAIVLLQYGSGPIRGFATTLLVGVAINTFTAVLVPRLIFDYFTRGRRVSTLSI